MMPTLVDDDWGGDGLVGPPDVAVGAAVLPPVVVGGSSSEADLKRQCNTNNVSVPDGRKGCYTVYAYDAGLDTGDGEC